MYALATMPLINDLDAKCKDENVKQSWYADDSVSAGSLEGIKCWWENLVSAGPHFGYHPKASKTWLIVKEDKYEAACKLFKNTGINITKEGHRHLGAAVGTDEFKCKYVSAKVSGWVDDVFQLTEIAKEEPQACYSAFTKGLCRRWTYIQRTISDISTLFQPLEDAIRHSFIPSLIGREISDIERRLIALPTRFGGLGIANPVETADIEYITSTFITDGLTNLIYNQKPSIDELDTERVMKCKDDKRKEKDARYQKELEEILQKVDPLTSRSIKTAKEKSASAWLTALPLQRMGFVLNKQEFRDAICLRYSWKIPDMPNYCGCGDRNDVVHSLTCKKGGYVALRHNSLRDGLANIMKEVCTDVSTEPMLLPTNPNLFNSRVNTAEEARLDIAARGINSTFERTLFDVRVAHPFAASNVVLPLDGLYKKHEQEKCNLYRDRVREVEKASFEPLVFLTTGGMGPQCTSTVKKLARMIAEKRQESYADIMSFIRTKLRFSLLRSVLIAIRGERGRPSAKEPHMGLVAFNLVPSVNDYET